jgi:hypothetical protein
MPNSAGRPASGSPAQLKLRRSCEGIEADHLGCGAIAAPWRLVFVRRPARRKPSGLHICPASAARGP